MNAYLKRLPARIRAVMRLAAQATRQATPPRPRQPVYLVGGFVRDMILARPNFDVDLVIAGDALRFAGRFAQAARAGCTRHRRFGTATVLLPGCKVDFATARKETYPYPGSLPVVAPGSLQDDLYRRDFSINTMAVELSGGGGLGSLIDPYRGQDDLRAKKIRVLHDLSFIDDPTRILRAIRFEQRFGFRIEPHTLKLLKESVAGAMLDKVGPQRIRDELILLLKEDDPIKPVWRMRALTGFSFIHPALAVTAKTRSLFKNIKRRSAGSRQAWLLYYMALIDPLSEKEATGLCEKFAFTKEQRHSIMDYKRSGVKLERSLKKKSLRPSQVYALCRPHTEAALLMVRSGARAGAVRKHVAEYVRRYQGVSTAINGDDLKRLGLEPGPRYEVLLTAVLRARLDGLARTRSGELAYVKKLISKRR